MEEKQTMPTNDSLEQAEFLRDAGLYLDMAGYSKNPRIVELMKKDIRNKITDAEKVELEKLIDIEDKELRDKFDKENL